MKSNGSVGSCDADLDIGIPQGLKGQGATSSRPERTQLQSRASTRCRIRGLEIALDAFRNVRPFERARNFRDGSGGEDHSDWREQSIRTTRTMSPAKQSPGLPAH
jgi:hypothetical protein